MFVQEPCMQEFKSTVDITHMPTQDKSDHLLPAPGIEFAHPGILTVDTIADDRIVLIDERQERFQITNVELPIRVHKKGEFFVGSTKATDQSSSVALIDFMCDETNAGISRSNRGDNGPGLIRTAIVEHNDLEVLHPATE